MIHRMSWASATEEKVAGARTGSKKGVEHPGSHSGAVLRKGMQGWPRSHLGRHTGRG